jgi:mono/diheme cytochrome c family protein
MFGATPARAVLRWRARRLVAVAILAMAAAEAGADELDRGQYLTRAAGCISCHTDGKGGGEPFAGGLGLKTPFGTYYSPNITPDKETGIGKWSDGDFLAALKHGLRPDGAHYFPVFPYTSYTQMHDGDALAIKAYLFSLPPVSRPNRPHDVWPPFSWRWPLFGWKWRYFEAGEFKPDAGRDEAWNRGAYLVGALAHCGECHTPRDAAGGLRRDMWMAGTEDGPDGDPAPNLTPDLASGLGWTEEQLAFFLKTGTKPGWDAAEGVMEEAIMDSYKYLTESDRLAIARYITSLPAIENHIGAQQ